MSWNKNLDYETTYKALSFAITSKAIEMKKFHKPERKRKVCILLIALRNGARLSEAIDGYNQFVENNKVEQTVRVRKRGYEYEKLPDGTKKRKSDSTEPENPVFRTLIIPDVVPTTLGKYPYSTCVIHHFAVRMFHFNPHALRYAFITYMSKKGVAPQLIAKMTKHASLSMILDYCEQEQADDILRQG